MKQVRVQHPAAHFLFFFPSPVVPIHLTLFTELLLIQGLVVTLWLCASGDWLMVRRTYKDTSGSNINGIYILKNARLIVELSIHSAFQVNNCISIFHHRGKRTCYFRSCTTESIAEATRWTLVEFSPDTLIRPLSGK